MTKIIFVRHGEAQGNINHIFHGMYNAPLTENGRKQAYLVAKALSGVPIDVMYSSDLSRAVETAYYISKEKGLRVNLCNKLREIHGGLWENVPWADLPIKFPQQYDLWLNRAHLLTTPKGESMVQFLDRLYKSLNEIVNANINKTICVVTHGAAIKALTCKLKGFDLSEFTKIVWYDNASITIVNIEGNNIKFEMEGDNSHLGETSTFARQDWWRI